MMRVRTVLKHRAGPSPKRGSSAVLAVDTPGAEPTAVPLGKISLGF
jgi:hypothetical protein